MRTLTTTLLTLLTLTLHAQFDFNRNGFVEPQFHMIIRFEDAKGHKDSVIVGVDERAGFWPDTIFGTKYITAPFDSVFEVRADNTITRPSREFMTKILIHGYLPWFCTPAYWNLTQPAYYAIHIRAKYFPVKVSWDRNVIKDRCYRMSHIGRLPYAYDLNITRIFKDTSAWILTKDFLEQATAFDDRNISQVTIQGGTKANVYSLYYSICAESLLLAPVSVYEAKAAPAFEITPNPTRENLCFYPSDAYSHWQQIEIWRIDGVKVQSYTPAACLDVGHLQQGMYVLRGVSRSGQSVAIPFVK